MKLDFDQQEADVSEEEMNAAWGQPGEWWGEQEADSQAAFRRIVEEETDLASGQWFTGDGDVAILADGDGPFTGDGDVAILPGRG